jgi:hypothetical protein
VDGEQRTVLSPEVLGRSFFDPECRKVLEYWRDGKIRLVVTRGLLERYLRLLDKLGASPELLCHWRRWFTAPEKSLYMPERDPFSKSDVERCVRAAQLGNARWVVLEQRAAGHKVRWRTLSSLLASEADC